MRWASVLVPAWAFVLALSAADACAEDVESLIRQGNDLRRHGDYSRAYGYFRRAYEMAHTARTAAQLGLAEQSIESFAESEHHLSEALGAADPWVDQNRAALEGAREKARSRLGRLQVLGLPPESTLAIGTQDPRPLPSDGVVWATPGQITLRVVAPGQKPVSKNLSFVAGATVMLDFTSEGKAREPAEPKRPTSPPGSSPSDTILGAPPHLSPVGTGLRPEPRVQPVSALVTVQPELTRDHEGRRFAGIAIAGVGVVVGVAGFFVYRSGADKVGAINQATTSGGTYDPSDGNWRTLVNAGTVAMAVGGTAMVAGSLLYLWGRRAHEIAAPTARLGLSRPENGGWMPHLYGTF